MAFLPELDQWEAGIYQLETTDPVLGGPDGVDNAQGKQLANRTLYLKNLIALLAPLASPTLTGVPTAPTPAGGTNTTQLATTAFVQAAITALINSSPAVLDTLNELATALGNDPNFATTITNALALKAPLASPALSGVPTAPTPAGGTNTAQLATTAFVQAAVAALSATLAGLTDTNIAALADNHVLQYDNVTSKWVNRTLAAAGIAAVADVLMKAGGTMSGAINMGGNAISNASNLGASVSGLVSEALTLQNTSAGGGKALISLFSGTLGNAVAGDLLLSNTVGNLIISPNAAGKTLKLIPGTWDTPVVAEVSSTGLAVTGKTTINVTRTASTSATALDLSDNVTGQQTSGVYKSIRSLSSGGNSISEIRFKEVDGTNNNTEIGFLTQATAGFPVESLIVKPAGASVTGVLAVTGSLTATTSIAATTTLKSGGYTVATLPAGSAGMLAYVTDALNPAWDTTLTGGGAVVCPVFYNTAWVAAVTPPQLNYVSAPQVITTAGALTLAHGLGAAPSSMRFQLECVTAEMGYTVGDKVDINPAGMGYIGGAVQKGHAVKADATNIYVRYSSDGFVYGHFNFTTGGFNNLTNANWRLIVTAWA